MTARWTLQLVSEPDARGVPVELRLRLGLKLLKRVCRLRCVGVKVDETPGPVPGARRRGQPGPV